MTKKRVGVLISGRGSNMESLAQACASPDYPAQIALVVSNRPGAPGLERAQAAGLKTQVVDHTAFADRTDFEEELDRVLRAAGAELLCNAGFMRLLTAGFVQRWQDRHLNIHPSLLPAYKGLRVHERVLAAAETLTGCTVHYVRPDMDAGPIIGQRRVAVRPGDTPTALAARVLAAEHVLYPHVLRLVASGRAPVINGGVQLAA